MEKTSMKKTNMGKTNMKTKAIELLDALRDEVMDIEVKLRAQVDMGCALVDKLDDYDYDYPSRVRADMEAWLDKWEREGGKPSDYRTSDDMMDNLFDRMRLDDDVTGARRGSYTCDRRRAERFLAHNRKLLVDALEYLGRDVSFREVKLDDAEACDALVREYCVCTMLEMVLDDRYHIINHDAES